MVGTIGTKFGCAIAAIAATSARKKWGIVKWQHVLSWKVISKLTTLTTIVT